MRIKYIGNLSPARVNVRGSIIQNWRTGETREFNEEDARHLLKQRYFVEEKESTKKKETPKSSVSQPEEEVETQEVRLTDSSSTITESTDDSKQIKGDE